jgi:5-(carboxyamino)imidazole ribonucleotide synthase
VILPGATLGMLGGGQLGRMFTVAARTMGYRVLVLDPDPLSPAAQLADRHLLAPYDDETALGTLARECAAVTTEFENAPASSMDWLARHCVVRPSGRSVSIAQDRIAEKSFLMDSGFPVAPCAFVHARADLAAAVRQVGTPAILKSSRLGYDGKGQATVADGAGIEAAFDALGGVPCVLERRVALDIELSVVVARADDGSVTAYPVAENRHAAGILDVSIVPARAPSAVAGKVVDMARDIAACLDYVGVMAVEFFVTASGEVMVNEIAPRPHNSGHYTLDACITSQFEQQVRMLCGLPAGDTRLHTPAVMVNLLGDVWHGSAPAWDALFRDGSVKLHLYGKREARPGRKMGHYTVLDTHLEAALERALRIKSDLSS